MIFRFQQQGGVRTACDTSGRFPIIPWIRTRLNHRSRRSLRVPCNLRPERIGKKFNGSSVRRMGMNRIRRVARLAMSASLCCMVGSALNTQAGQDAGKQPYTMPEYNAEQACANDKNPSSQIKCLDDFVSKYPNSALLVYAYPMYYQAYFQQKNYAKVIEYADKAVGLGDKLGPNER